MAAKTLWMMDLWAMAAGLDKCLVFVDEDLSWNGVERSWRRI